jgi:hypothetical protein
LDVGNLGPRSGGGLHCWMSSWKGGRSFVMVDATRHDTLVLFFFFLMAIVIMQSVKIKRLRVWL